MSFWTTLLHGSVPRLTRIAAFLALLGLAVIAFSIVVPRPLSVIFAMSIGHVIGGAAFTCYLVAVLLDAYRSSSVTKGRPEGEP